MAPPPSLAGTIAPLYLPIRVLELFTLAVDLHSSGVVSLACLKGEM